MAGLGDVRRFQPGAAIAHPQTTGTYQFIPATQFGGLAVDLRYHDRHIGTLADATAAFIAATS